MLKINSNQLAEEPWTSPQGKFAGSSKSVSEALGRKPQSTDLNERHPFDVVHDSKKWAVRSPERRVFRGEPLEHYDGEE